MVNAWCCRCRHASNVRSHRFSAIIEGRENRMIEQSHQTNVMIGLARQNELPVPVAQVRCVDENGERCVVRAKPTKSMFTVYLRSSQRHEIEHTHTHKILCKWMWPNERAKEHANARKFRFYKLKPNCGVRFRYFVYSYVSHFRFVRFLFFFRFSLGSRAVFALRHCLIGQSNVHVICAFNRKNLNFESYKWSANVWNGVIATDRRGCMRRH